MISATPIGGGGRPRRTWARTVALGAAAALTLSACGSGDSGGAGGDGGETGDGGQITLRFAWWGSDTRHQATEEIIAAYEEQNPDVDIQPEPGDWSGYWDKLATQVAASDAPDIIQMDEKYIREYADRGALLDLQDVDVSDISEDTVATGETPEGRFGIATGINAIVIMANPQIFEAAGVEMPDDQSWTWQDYGDIAAEIDQNSEFYGATTPNEPSGLEVWLRQQGKDLINESGELAFESADLEQYFQLQLDLLKQGALPQPSILSEDQNTGPDQSLTGTGQVAMGHWWTNQIASLSETSGADLVPLRMPQTEGTDTGHGLYYKSSMFMSGNANTEHPDVVQDFIDFMINSEEAGMINLADRGLPASQTVRDAVVPELGEADQRAAEFLQDIEDELGDAKPIPPLGYSAIQEILMRYEMEVFFERQTPAEAAEAAYAEIESAIAG